MSSHFGLWVPEVIQLAGPKVDEGERFISLIHKHIGLIPDTSRGFMKLRRSNDLSNENNGRNYRLVRVTIGNLKNGHLYFHDRAKSSGMPNEGHMIDITRYRYFSGYQGNNGEQALEGELRSWDYIPGDEGIDWNVRIEKWDATRSGNFWQVERVN